MTRRSPAVRAPGLIGLLGALAVALVAPGARANGRLPEANQLVVAPDDPQQLLLRVTFGLLFSNDGGQSWDWMCEHAIVPETDASLGGFGSQDPAVTLLAGGAAAAGIVEGLALSPDRGCSWSYWPSTANTLVVDVARDPTGLSAVAVTNVYSHTDDAGAFLYDTQVLHTGDAGKSWQPLTGTLDPALVIETIDLAASDPQRVYLTGEPAGAMGQASLAISHDTGQSYTYAAIPLLPQETAAYIAAVDPLVADHVYVRTLGKTDAGSGKTSRLLVTPNAGQSWSEAWSGDAMLGFALSPDGTRVYIGSVGAGLLAADTSTLVFTQQSTIQVQCLMASGGTLYACSNEPSSGFIVGRSTDEGKTFAPLLELATIHGPIQCPPNVSASVCVSEWPKQAAQFGIDAGTEPPPPPPSSGCHCASAQPSGTSGSSAWWLAVGLVGALPLARRIGRKVKPRSRPFRGAR